MQNKSHLFSKELTDLASFAKALSHPARISIIRALIERKTISCGEMVNLLPLSQPAVSRHLAELKKVNVIQDRPCGTKSCYSLNTKLVEIFCQAFQKNIKPRKSL